MSLFRFCINVQLLFGFLHFCFVFDFFCVVAWSFVVAILIANPRLRNSVSSRWLKRVVFRPWFRGTYTLCERQPRVSAGGEWRYTIYITAEIVKNIVLTVRNKVTTSAILVARVNLIVVYRVYRQPAPDPHGSRTGSRYDLLARGTPLHGPSPTGQHENDVDV